MMLVLLCMCMYRIAELEKRRGWLWAFIALFMVMLFQSVWGYVLAFVLMLLADIYRPVKKGPFLR